MKQKTVVLAALASACLATSVASAGSHANFGFYVSPSNGYSRFANGSFGEIRNSPDPNSFAECGSNATTGWCAFGEADGSYQACWTTDPAQLAVIRSMGDSGFFSVSWYEQTGECSYILHYTTSRSAPKEP